MKKTNSARLHSCDAAWDAVPESVSVQYGAGQPPLGPSLGQQATSSFNQTEVLLHKLERILMKDADDDTLSHYVVRVELS